MDLSNRTILPGSVREATRLAPVIGAPPPEQLVEVLLVIRRRSTGAGALHWMALGDTGLHFPRKRRYCSDREYSDLHGALPQDIETVREFAAHFDLEVVRSHPARRSIWLKGTIQNFCRAFGVTAALFEGPSGSYLGFTEDLSVPSELAGIVRGVFGLDRRPAARPYFRMGRQFPSQSKPKAVLSNQESAATGALGPWTPPQVGAMYDFPANATGAGQCIGIVELGGGYQEADLQVYFQTLNLPMPSLVSVSVAGATNSPGDPSFDPEVMLDIEVAGSLAPGARVAVYFAPNSESGFISAVSAAIHDTTNHPSVISISWGEDESYWSEQARAVFNGVLQEAGLMGVTICVAAGDLGAADGVLDGQAHVSFPASSPYVLACGGTSQVQSDDQTITEIVWNEMEYGGGASGGGVSTANSLPDYQKGLASLQAWNPSQPGRGIPDVAGLADSQTAYLVRVNGVETLIGGTSAVAPLWAALIARINQAIGTQAGYLNPLLYSQLNQVPVTWDIADGNNGLFEAATGWDACTGWGIPNGSALLKALSQG